jgi:Astacin (Peptidase family M12A)
MTERKSPRPKRPDSTTVSHWYRSSDDVRTGFVSGNAFAMKRVRYAAIGDLAIFEGDIALGTVAQMERVTRAAADLEALPASGVAITDGRFRWPNGVIPYVIDAGLSNPQRVTDAMAEWMDQTPLRFVVRDAGNPDHANFVSFEEQDGCWSEVGMRGGMQIVSLGPSCDRGSALHEIGHVAGLWHEQSRADRDEFVRVLWENIQDGREHNFDQRITDGDDIGDYDYDSIMHYPAIAFSRNGQPTIVARDGHAIGQRLNLSPGDIAAVRSIYAGTTPPVTPPEPVPGRGESGVQRLGTIPAFDSRRWVTQDWPVDVNVLWSIIPSPIAARVEWNIVTERQSGVALRYYIEVRNLSGAEATVDARYTLF